MIVFIDSQEVPIRSKEEAMEMFRVGIQNRRTAETKMNHESSRSHCLFLVRCAEVIDQHQRLTRGHHVWVFFYSSPLRVKR